VPEVSSNLFGKRTTAARKSETLVSTLPTSGAATQCWRNAFGKRPASRGQFPAYNQGSTSSQGLLARFGDVAGYRYYLEVQE
jgi:hypothetical protein